MSITHPDPSGKVTSGLRWFARIAAITLAVAATPFYLGYGNPLPFLDPAYTAHDNAWLCAFPLILGGLILGCFRQRLGGAMIVGSIAAAELVTVITQAGFVPHMLVPFAVGCLFLWVGEDHRARRPESNRFASPARD